MIRSISAAFKGLWWPIGKTISMRLLKKRGRSLLVKGTASHLPMLATFIMATGRALIVLVQSWPAFPRVTSKPLRHLPRPSATNQASVQLYARQETCGKKSQSEQPNSGRINSGLSGSGKATLMVK
jgi:hypothetical protein